jgi:hypothetical protein
MTGFTLQGVSVGVGVSVGAGDAVVVNVGVGVAVFVAVNVGNENVAGTPTTRATRYCSTIPALLADNRIFGSHVEIIGTIKG